MHQPVTNSPSATNALQKPLDDDIQTPTSRNYSTNHLGWHIPHDSNTRSSLNSPLSTSGDISSALSAIRRPLSVGLNKISFPYDMPGRTENGTSDRSSAPSDSWRVVTVDPENSWDLHNEMVRMKIGEAASDAEDVHSQLHTPPKSKMAAVSHLSEASLETLSNPSADSSPHGSAHEISISHSRGSSTDTSVSSSQESLGSGHIMAKPPLTVNTSNEIKGRPHSLSGALPVADLRRLQATDPGEMADQQRPQGLYREHTDVNTEQLSYPSITNHIHRPQPHPYHPMFEYRGGQPQPNQSLPPTHEDMQPDYNLPPRNFNPGPQGHLAPPGPPFIQGRHNSNVPSAAYRQPPRGYQGVIASPPMAYATHTSHLSLGNTQQLYDMMLPGSHDGHHPAVARVQQQHNVFRPAHHHSASDPSAAIRDAATIALMNNNMQQFGPGLFQPGHGMPTMPMYPNQYYASQDQYQIPDLATNLQTQYTGQYAVMPPQGSGMSPESVGSPTSTNGQGPSANNRKLGLYKTELCRSWEEKGTCRYGAKCQFAHGEDELRRVARHPKYKTEICRTFWVSGTCPYGKRCCFIHTELPTSGTGTAGSTGTPATDVVPQQQRPDGRSRSLSTNSDPNDANVSLLSRISSQRTPDSNSVNTPVDGNSFQFTRPPTGSLRVDTSALDTSVKQNKSAYPTFASNGILLPAPERKSTKSPAPVTAGPDLGRHNNARREIVGYNNPPQRTHKSNASTSSSVRHSFNGSEVDMNFSPSPPIPGQSSFTLASSDIPARPSGHVRAGSAGNWANLTRSSHLAQSAYPGDSSPVGEVMTNSPWSSTELAVGTSRLHEKVWA